MNIIELSVDIVDGEFLILNNNLPVGNVATTGIFRFEIINLDKNNKLALRRLGTRELEVVDLKNALKTLPIEALPPDMR